MNRDTYDKFNMSEEEYALYKEKEEAAEKKAKEAEEAEKEKASKDKKGKKDAEKKDSEADDKSKDIEIDFDGIEHRIMRLTPMSSTLASAALTNDGETLYFLSAFEEGFDLWELETRTGAVSLLKKLNTSYASLAFDKDEKNLYILGYRPQIMSMGGNQIKPVNFNMTMELDRAAERAYMMDHVFKQEEKKFYTDTYHGVDLKQLVPETHQQQL